MSDLLFIFAAQIQNKQFLKNKKNKKIDITLIFEQTGCAFFGLRDTFVFHCKD